VCIEGYTKDFASDLGVKEGCASSPLLFCLYIDELQNTLQRENALCQPPYFSGVPVGLNLFADDFKLHAWSSSGLQHALNIMAVFSAKKGLSPNPKKKPRLWCGKIPNNLRRKP
jgi:hypothetical protein